MTRIESLRVELEGAVKRADDRHEKVVGGDLELSGCFVSAHCATLSIELLRTKIEILENGGLSEFEVLLNLDGTIASDNLCKTRFGYAYRVVDRFGEVKWVNPGVKEKTLEKKGYRLGYVEKPAWAYITGSGKGLAGVGSAYVEVFPSDTNYALE